jgi:3-oxoacyl-[acyl-carrier-protein] synthase II
MRRIVVTGLGAVSPLGCGVELIWSRLISGRSGLRALPATISADLTARVAGMVPDKAEDTEGGFDPDSIVARKEQRKMDRFILFAMVAAAEAIAQAGWAPVDAQSLERTATVIASGIGGFPAIVEAVRITDQRGIRRLSPFTVPSFLVNLAAGHVSIRYGYKGPIGAPVTACAAGVQAIGDAARLPGRRGRHRDLRRRGSVHRSRQFRRLCRGARAFRRSSTTRHGARPAPSIATAMAL